MDFIIIVDKNGPFLSMRLSYFSTANIIKKPIKIVLILYYHI